MNKSKWLKFMKILDTMVNKHNISHKAAQICLIDDNDHNRTLLSDLWSDIAKCFQRTANKTVPLIIVNENTSINAHNHEQIRDRVA